MSQASNSQRTAGLEDRYGRSLPESAQRRTCLAREERSAALRALAGRLAHQIRNPLAAVRAACNGLRDEVQEADQRETLDLALAEIDRMLGFVSSTVQSLPSQREPQRDVQIDGEIRDVVALIGSTQQSAVEVVVGDQAEGACRLPLEGFRVAIYSLLDHLVDIHDLRRVVLSSRFDDGLLRVRLEIDGEADGNALVTTGLTVPGGWMHPVGFLVAERFARDHGGRLRRQDVDANRLTLCLELPCSHG
jgi:signal transduction histidine kinase